MERILNIWKRYFKSNIIIEIIGRRDFKHYMSSYYIKSPNLKKFGLDAFSSFISDACNHFVFYLIHCFRYGINQQNFGGLQWSYPFVLYMNRLKWKLKRCEDVEKNDDWNIKYLKENFQQWWGGELWYSLIKLREKTSDSIFYSF